MSIVRFALPNLYPPGEPYRYRNHNVCIVISDGNPYQSGSDIGQPLDVETPAWRRTLGSLLRISGAIVIAIPVVAFAFDLPDANINDYLNDLPAIITALCCYLGFGALMIYLGNKLSAPRRRLRRAQNDLGQR
ncbi:hypothetical protein [Rubripirellula amarantea]|uniref:hypothetical protein n=1 Tax=Rubripirellula amarantea TaxID=2527999 RepID=UPI0011B4D500|nr:hypothetical protein [Rubripirellula amarantea]